jgi:ketosteroid isomerase-like protein
MTDRDEFLSWVETRLIPADRALHDGDAGPRFAIWSMLEPVTVVGAWKSASGPDAVGDLFRELEGTFSDCVSFAFQITAAEVRGDMAYTAGLEHIQTSVDGEPRTFSLRVTQIYRHEGGEWKVAHRHADTVGGAAPPPRFSAG